MSRRRRNTFANNTFEAGSLNTKQLNITDENEEHKISFTYKKESKTDSESYVMTLPNKLPTEFGYFMVDNEGVVSFESDIVGSNVVATGGTTSDRRAKKKISDLGPSLSEVMKMRPVRYIMKKDETERVQMGFIAQDLQKTHPECVYFNKHLKCLQVQYGNLVASLVSSIQELSKKVESLEKKIPCKKKCTIKWDDIVGKK